MRRVLWVLMMLLVTEAWSEEDELSYYADPAFNVEITSYTKATGRHPYSVAFLFSDDLSYIGERVIGACYPQSKIIRILRSYWDRATPEMREQLIFHELGHCDMGQDHREEVFADNCPKSLMNHEAPTTQCYIKHRNELIAELIANNQNRTK